MLEFRDKSPQEAASMLLAKFRGVQRNAEVEAWKHAEGFATDSQSYRYWVETVRAIVFGGEFPAVDRKPLTLAEVPVSL